MSDIYCGLCKKKVENWKEHMKSEEHQKSLSDPNKIMDAVDDSAQQMIDRMSGKEEK